MAELAELNQVEAKEEDDQRSREFVQQKRGKWASEEAGEAEVVSLQSILLPSQPGHGQPMFALALPSAVQPEKCTEQGHLEGEGEEKGNHRGHAEHLGKRRMVE
jgi:hypothetical protein